MWLAFSSAWILLLATLPIQERPRALTDPQTKRSPLTYPPCPLSQVFKVLGLQDFPQPERAMATELIKQPALQMVFDEVPSCQPPHLLSHCLQTGQVLHAERTRMSASATSFIAIGLLIDYQSTQIYLNSISLLFKSTNTTFLYPGNAIPQNKLYSICHINFIKYASHQKQEKNQQLRNSFRSPPGERSFRQGISLSSIIDADLDGSKDGIKIAMYAMGYQVTDNPYMAQAMQQQLLIHRSLSHANIVGVIDVVQTANNYYIFMEFCEQGNLRNLILKHSRLTQQDALHCLKCICRAFQPMFQKGIIHRDLKPENIVIKNQHLKVTDFGFAKALSSSRQLTRTVIGTPLYMSPQILSKQPYSSKCDIWSIGVIYYEILIGHHPWAAKSMNSLYRTIANSPNVSFPSQIQISQQSKVFIKKCLQIQQHNRFSWLQLYESELLGAQFQAIANKWRNAYQTAAFKLNKLKSNVQIEKLVGLFLRLKVNALNFPQFCIIMRSLIPQAQEAELGPMYELFDKDSNGVIDFEQFVGALSDCPVTVLQHMNQLLMNGWSYSELSDRERYNELVKQLQSNPQVSQYAYALISNMDMGEEEA